MARKLFSEKIEKQRGQVRAERAKTPVYTAVYKVNRSDELLEFLLRKCNTSRNNVKSLLAKRQILVNGSVVTQYNFPLAKDDEVKIAKSSVQGNDAPRRERALQRAHKLEMLKIIYEDDDLIAVDKPEGLLSVESDRETDCAFARVLEYLRQTDKTARPYVLHRIDKETSGVLVFAKNIKLHSILKLHWNESVILREYYAVAEGVFEKSTDTLENYLTENKNNLVYVTHDKSAQKAVTHYEELAQTDKYALLRVKIDTGRKNQIRVQLKHDGHAIVGDDKYGANENPLNRLALHASAIEFIHPFTKEIVSIRATVPPMFRALF